MAVYFHVDPLPYQSCKTGQDNNSGNGSERVCPVPPGSIAQDQQEPERSWKHWLTQKLFSVAKYLVFGAFVLACNKLRRYVKVHRQRSASSSTDIGVVSAVCVCGGGGGGGYVAVALGTGGG